MIRCRRAASGAQLWKPPCKAQYHQSPQSPSNHHQTTIKPPSNHKRHRHLPHQHLHSHCHIAVQESRMVAFITRPVPPERPHHHGTEAERHQWVRAALLVLGARKRRCGSRGVLNEAVRPIMSRQLGVIHGFVRFQEKHQRVQPHLTGAGLEGPIACSKLSVHCTKKT